MALEEVNVGKQPVTIYHSDGTSTIEMKECVDYHATGKDVQALKGLGRKAGEQKAQYDAALERKIGLERASGPLCGTFTARADSIEMIRSGGVPLGAAAFSIVAPSTPWNRERRRRSGRFKAIYRNGIREVLVDTLKEDDGGDNDH